MRRETFEGGGKVRQNVLKVLLVGKLTKKTTGLYACWRTPQKWAKIKVLRLSLALFLRRLRWNTWLPDTTPMMSQRLQVSPIGGWKHCQTAFPGSHKVNVFFKVKKQKAKWILALGCKHRAKHSNKYPRSFSWSQGWHGDQRDLCLPCKMVCMFFWLTSAVWNK